MMKGTKFQIKVWKYLLKIPKGRVVYFGLLDASKHQRGRSFKLKSLSIQLHRVKRDVIGPAGVANSKFKNFWALAGDDVNDGHILTFCLPSTRQNKTVLEGEVVDRSHDIVQEPHDVKVHVPLLVRARGCKHVPWHVGQARHRLRTCVLYVPNDFFPATAQVR